MDSVNAKYIWHRTFLVIFMYVKYFVVYHLSDHKWSW